MEDQGLQISPVLDMVMLPLKIWLCSLEVLLNKAVTLENQVVGVVLKYFCLGLAGVSDVSIPGSVKSIYSDTYLNLDWNIAINCIWDYT